jgi:hypothetical protein
VGMHGAALTYALYLPPHAGVLELWPKPADMWRCFEHISSLAGLVYERWANAAFPAGYRQDEAGDYTTVDVPAASAGLGRVLAQVVERREQRRRAAAAGSAGAVVPPPAAVGGGDGEAPGKEGGAAAPAAAPR